MNNPGPLRPVTGRQHGKSVYNRLVIAAHVAAGWTAKEVHRGVTMLTPPPKDPTP